MGNKRIVEAVACVTIVSAITRLIAFMFKIYLSRTLGAEVLGVYQITLSIFVLLMSVCASGLPTALSRHIATLSSSGNSHKINGITTSALLIGGGFASLIIAIIYLFPNISRLMFSDDRCRDMLLIMLPALLSSTIYCVLRGYFWGLKEYSTYAGVELAEEVLSIIIVISTLSLGIYGGNLTKGVATAFVISDYVGLIVIVVLFVWRGAKLSKPCAMRPLMASAMPLTSSRILGSIVSSSMALILPIMLTKYGVEDATASYGRASGMVMPLITIPATIMNSLAVVVVPELASAHTRKAHLSKPITSALTFSLVVSSLFVCIYIAVGDTLCEVLYKDSIAGSFMLVASLIIVPMSMNQMAVSVLNTLGHENTTFIAHLMGSVVLAIIIFIMPKYIYIYAYFTALILFHLTTLMVYMRKINKLVKLDNNLLFKALLLPVFALIVGFGMHALSNILNNCILGTILIGIIILISYGIVVIKLDLISVNFLGKKCKKITKN